MENRFPDWAHGRREHEGNQCPAPKGNRYELEGEWVNKAPEVYPKEWYLNNHQPQQTHNIHYTQGTDMSRSLCYQGHSTALLSGVII